MRGTGLAEYEATPAESRLNEFPQFTTAIDGQDLHFACADLDPVRGPDHEHLPAKTPLRLS